MFDTHMHTKFSSDSKMTIEEVIKRSNEINIGAIITEHMDLKFPRDDIFVFDAEKYFNEYSKYRGDSLLLGIEIGMKSDCIIESREVVEKYAFDYVIGSVHLLDNMDLYYPEYYKNKSKKEAYENYFRAIYASVKSFDFIDTLGHIDFMARYAKYHDREIYYKDHLEIINEILKVLIEKDKCLELNTRRLNDENAVKNLIPIYKRYRELGGKNVTIGSDAHGEESISSNFNVAKEIIELCDLKIVYFKERRREYDKI